MYENLIIYYFSGTGNAKHCAEWIISAAKEKGLNTFLINIDKFKQVELPKVEGNTLIGFCSATHGFNMPPLMLDYIFQFPKAKKKTDVFVLNTRGGMKLYKIFTPGLSGVALILPAFVLGFKGYRITGYRPVDLPSNWISLHPGLSKKVVDSIYTHWKPVVTHFAEKILSGKKVYRGLYDLPLDLMIAPVAIGYYLIGRFGLAKTFFASYTCDKCMLCLKNCPIGAIKQVDGRMYWTNKCESCMRCMNQCPKRAIQTIHGITFLFWFLALTFIPLLGMKALLHLIPNFSGESWLAILFNNMAVPALCLVAVYFGYYVMHYLVRYKWLNVLVTYTSFTKYKFWRRYKAPKEF